jgi:predicted short-subunit dehydrogenase-like oxidoreductase (DUF2520 family)
MDRLTISIIGAGKVGSTLAVLLHRAGYPIVSVVSRKKNSAGKLARLVKCRMYSNVLSDVSPATRVIIIAVPEESIAAIAKELAGQELLNFRSLTVFHTSGSLTSDALVPFQRKGAMIFSLHPIQTFPTSISLVRQIRRMRGVVYGFEGRGAALPVARQLVHALGGTMARIPKEEKILYHVASVIASNYSVAMLGAVNDIIRQMHAGIKLAHFEPLVTTSIENAFQCSPVRALTGPIARGSVATIEQHVATLRKSNVPLAKLYSQAGLQALTMAIEGKLVQPAIAKQIRRVLELEIKKVKGTL